MRFRRPRPQHVRLHMIHEGASAGDMTVEGWLVDRRRAGGVAWLVMDRATILESDGGRTTLQGHVDVPAQRVLLVEHLVSVSAPLLDFPAIGAGT